MEDKSFLDIREILNKHDPVGVIFDDETVNEYDPEVKEVLQVLPSVKSEEELSPKLREIFVKYFDEQIAGDIEKYKEIATEILTVSELK